MTAPNVSVIVPCYNAEPFLRRCVESVLAQTEPGWELLLVNDGSTDGTSGLCRALAADDARIRVLEQENAGVSAARNAGLDAARGTYVTFIDSDDALAPAALETLLAAARRESADIAEGGMRYEDKTGAERWTYRPAPEVVRSAAELIARRIPAEHGMYSACRLLIRRDFLGETRFAPLTRGEDALFTAELYLRCGAFVSVGEVVYRYFLRADSVMRESFRPATLDFVRAWEKIYELLREKAPAAAPRAAEIVLWQCDRVFTRGMRSGDAAWPDCRRELKPVRQRFAALCAGTGAKKRLAAAAFAVSPELYYRLAGRAGK